MADLIDRQAVYEKIDFASWGNHLNKDAALRLVQIGVDNIPAVDAVEVVRCGECKHGIWDEEEGLWMCVFTADYDEELGVYHGFIQHNTADYYCADGKRREENGREHDKGL